MRYHAGRWSAGTSAVNAEARNAGLLARLDQAVFALVRDLETRSLLEDTLVLVMGEFGRTPVFSQRGLAG